MENPDVGSAETYSRRDVACYLRQAFGEDGAEVNLDVGKESELHAFIESKSNRREVFTHLAEHGWIVTGVHSGVWFERVA